MPPQTVIQARDKLSCSLKKIAINANIFATCSAPLEDHGKTQCCLFQPRHETKEATKDNFFSGETVA